MKNGKKSGGKKASNAKKSKSKDNGRGRTRMYPDNAKIALLVKENPHRKGTGRYTRWGKYRQGMTVAEAIKAGLKPVNLRYSVLDGHIRIS